MHNVSYGDKVFIFFFNFYFLFLKNCSFECLHKSLDILIFHYCIGNSTSKPAEIKIIDFGSACMENRTVYSYIQVIPDLHFILSILK